MSQAIDQMPRSPAEFVRGAVETAEEGGEWAFRRFTAGQAAAYREAGNDDFFQKTFASAGVRLALRTDAEALSFDYRFERGSSRAFGFFDVHVDGALAAHDGLETDDGARHAFAAGLGPGEKRVEVYFPWSRQTFVSNFALRRASFAEPLRRSRTMLCFGDSITQGYDARYPSLSYVEAVARFLDADPVNKAIGGDVFFPALLRERDGFDPDFVTVAYGTNDWRHKEPADVRDRAAAFFRRLAELYPAARILALAPLWRGEPASESAFGEDVRCMERLIREACAGLPNVTVVPGYNLIPHLAEFFSDGRLHPNDLGFGVLAQNLQRGLAALRAPQRTPGVVVRGHGVASGRAGDPRFPHGTVAMQIPFFRERGLDLAGFHPGTVNVDCAPLRFRPGPEALLFERVKWHPEMPAETFSFARATLVRDGARFPAWIYYPHPETKPEHFQPGGVAEIIAPLVPGLAYGDRVVLETTPDQALWENL